MGRTTLSEEYRNQGTEFEERQQARIFESKDGSMDHREKQRAGAAVKGLEERRSREFMERG